MSFQWKHRRNITNQINSENNFLFDWYIFGKRTKILFSLNKWIPKYLLQNYWIDLIDFRNPPPLPKKSKQKPAQLLHVYEDCLIFTFTDIKEVHIYQWYTYSPSAESKLIIRFRKRLTMHRSTTAERDRVASASFFPRI